VGLGDELVQEPVQQPRRTAIALLVPVQRERQVVVVRVEEQGAGDDELEHHALARLRAPGLFPQEAHPLFHLVGAGGIRAFAASMRAHTGAVMSAHRRASAGVRSTPGR
jgi:hypothetical protein